jgi:pyruvate dehydrogenase E2 component (dihydrolipoamide acetyltransferase)
VTSTEIRLIELADGMQAGKIVAWLKREGDAVNAGEAIVEVETDKANVEIESPVSGFVQRILVAAGTDVVPVNTVIALLSDQRPGAVETPAASALAPAPPTPAIGPRTPTAVPDFHIMPALSKTERPATRAPEPAPEVMTPAAFTANSAFNATSVARKIASLTGVDLAAVTPADGTRITKADVERALGRPMSPATAPAAAPVFTTASTAAAMAPAVTVAFEEQPLSNLRKVTAERLQRAKQTIPHFYLQIDCRIDALMDVRSYWNTRHPDAKLTITDFIVFAVSRALRQVPQANSAWAENAVQLYKSVDLAVAVNTPKGLITPVVRSCQEKSLGVISRQIAELAEHARAGKLRPDEYTGATFTISNLGMYGVTSITPIVNPPAACILGVGAIERRPVVANGQVVAGHTMSCTLAADHRAIDGAAGAEFMAALRSRLEDPYSLTVEG